MRAQQKRQHQPAEQAGPALLEAEHQELEGVAPGPAAIGRRLQTLEKIAAPPFEGQRAGVSHPRPR